PGIPRLDQLRIHHNQPTSDHHPKPRPAVAVLSAKLAALSAGIDQRRERVTFLEARHGEWQRWYIDALPTRYAGLAAAAEQTRRAAYRRANLADAVAATTARVRAIDDTRPQPHAAPVTPRLTQQANAARRRVSPTPDQTVAEETELD
ncbi:hypothetical protein GA0070558_1781, partial [Micromonospora haikouensis]